MCLFGIIGRARGRRSDLDIKLDSVQEVVNVLPLAVDILGAAIKFELAIPNMFGRSLWNFEVPKDVLG